MARSEIKICHSAREDICVPDILREVINNNVYKRDYEDVTMGLLFVPVSYDTVVQSLHKILDSKLWD